jgi:hypothetical protein
MAHMSHGTHGPAAHGANGHGPDPHVVGKLGMSKGALLFVLVAILCSIMQGSFVVAASSWNRVWPSINSTKLDLPPMHLAP